MMEGTGKSVDGNTCVVAEANVASESSRAAPKYGAVPFQMAADMRWLIAMAGLSPRCTCTQQDLAILALSLQTPFKN